MDTADALYFQEAKDDGLLSENLSRTEKVL
jgi:hypothetical protein